jgi:DNA-binding CsgD family transcriptional regulator
MVGWGSLPYHLATPAIAFVIIATTDMAVKEKKSQCYNFSDMTNPEINELSDRELDILKLVATGASNKEIAQKLFISSNTVKVHLRNIFNKINATSRTEAAMYAVRTGLVENASPQIGDKEDGYKKDDYAGAGVEVSLALPGEQKRFSQRRIVSSVILAGTLIVLVLLGVRYLPGNIFQISTPVPPTPTQRVQWFELPGLPTPRQGLAVVGYENLLYSIGGETNEAISNHVERFDPKTNQWVELAPKPISVTDINAALIGGLIYSWGRLASGKPTNVTEIFDLR